MKHILSACLLFLLVSCYNNPPYPSLENTSWRGTNVGQGRYLDVTFSPDGKCDAVFYIDSDGNFEDEDATLVQVATAAGSYTNFDGYTTYLSFPMSYSDGYKAEEGPLSGNPSSLSASLMYDNLHFFLTISTSEGRWSYPLFER